MNENETNEKLFELPNGDWILLSKITKIHFSGEHESCDMQFPPTVCIETNNTTVTSVTFDTDIQAKEFVKSLAEKRNNDSSGKTLN